MNKFTVAILVNNQFGVLNRVTSMFRRRAFNITSLTVSETESEEFSRITVQSEGDGIKKEQLINQLYKLPDIVSVKELSNEETVNRELLLIKIKNSSETREDVRSASDAYEGKVVDYTKESIMIQMIGDSRKIDNFVHLMKEFGILEICPLLNVDVNGHLTARSKVRTKKKVIQEIVKRMEACADKGLDYDGKCYISMSACLEDAQAVAALIEERFTKLDGKVQIYNIGTTIGSHTGPGTVALFFWGEKRNN